TDVLKKAEAGIYKKDKIMDDMDTLIISKYFKKMDPEVYQIIDDVKKRVVFKKFNLKSDIFSITYDIIFCRNVVIYFDDETKNMIYQKFYTAMNENGYFLVGPTEGIMNDERFKYISPGVYVKNVPKGNEP
ncbi:MAG: chemotaxis protein CheR, partial [bacterium]|nr:chemotaxis protein CheR [bacterium]